MISQNMLSFYVYFLVNRLTTYDRLAGKETCKGVLQEIRLNAETNIFFECSYAKRI